MLYITRDTHNTQDMENVSEWDMKFCCMEQGRTENLSSKIKEEGSIFDYVFFHVFLFGTGFSRFFYLCRFNISSSNHFLQHQLDF